MKRPLRALLLFAMLGGYAAWAQAKERVPMLLDQAAVEQFTDLVMQAMPFDAVFVAQGEGRASAEQLAQLQCIHNLYAPKYREIRRKNVVAFMAAYPGEVADSVQILQDGAAMLADTLGAGMYDADSRSHLTPAQSAAVATLMTDEKYEHLRKLLFDMKREDYADWDFDSCTTPASAPQ